MFDRVVLIILDSVGVGALDDAALYGDSQDVNTLGNTAKAVGGLKVPNLAKLGLGTLGNFTGIPALFPVSVIASKCKEQSKGKDTSSGHWEIAGLITNEPFATFDNGFPQSILDRLITENGLSGILCNRPRSGLQVLEEFGAEHIKSQQPIVYTSADSVLQIACDEDSFGLNSLYRLCESARTIADDYQIARVIARPFVKNKGTNSFKRTPHRRDYSIELPGKILFEYLADKGIDTHTIGKIASIYDYKGIKTNLPSKNNDEGMQILKSLLGKITEGLIAINLVDFDQEYGHRRNPKGYASALEDFDDQLGPVIDCLSNRDLLVITADHGNDPTAPGNDHTREYIPFLIHSPILGPSSTTHIEPSFTSVGATIYQGLTGRPFVNGRSLISNT